jgi:hypothetical protein
MSNLDSCCNRYFGYMNQLACIASSSGGAYTGSNKYYPRYLESKCAQDCESGANCGGVITDTSTPLFSSVQECCSEVFGQIDLDLCVELSIPSGGTNKYFADIPRSICLKDCTGAGCTRVTNPSTKLYGDLSTCCSQGLPWVIEEFCTTRSMQQTTNKWFASPVDHTCRQDCVSGATCANLTDPTESLYATALECCQSELTFMPADNCNTLSLGNPLTGSSKWFVSYKVGEERCYQDCPEGTGNCGGLADPDVQLFDNSTACCQTKLPHKRLAYCESVSGGNQWTGSGEFYPGMLLNLIVLLMFMHVLINIFKKDYFTSTCVADCDEATAGCGGIITDALSKRLFATAAECCEQTLPTIDPALCEDRSSGTGTGKYYAEPGSPVCSQDSGLNRVANPNTRLYNDTNACCREALPWVSFGFCTSRSAGSYSDKWYVADYTTQTCAKDCATGGANCVPATYMSIDLYDTSLECCRGKLSWLDSAICDANSNGTPIASTFTNKFYVDYASNACKQDCVETDPAPCGGNPSSDKTLFDSAESCCREKLSWLDLNLCVSNTNGVAPTGSNRYYVDWTILKCVKVGEMDSISCSLQVS